MKIDDFDFHLPKKLIAQYRDPSSKLLCLNKETGQILHRKFEDLPSFLSKKDLLIFNDTKVIPARLYGKKDTGGKVEILIERVMQNNKILSHIKASKPPKIGSTITINDKYKFQILEKNDFYTLKLLYERKISLIDLLDEIGHIPLPPYIKRPDEKSDELNYQSIFAKKKGSVAAPTASLHFNECLLKKINQKEIKTDFITLHIGSGTFSPVREKEIEKHKMHTEYFDISSKTCQKINEIKKEKGRIIAVGTTSTRSLESAFKNGKIAPFKGETDIFIYPGYEFKTTDALITNFHLPKSTLFMLVCAFAGTSNTKKAYEEAIKKNYKFYSYGDAMFISSR